MYSPSQSYAALAAPATLITLEARTADEVRAACLVNAVVKATQPLEVGVGLRLPEALATAPELAARRDAVRLELTAVYDNLVAAGSVDTTALADAEAWADSNKTRKWAVMPSWVAVSLTARSTRKWRRSRRPLSGVLRAQTWPVARQAC
eukprot:1857426-Pyramimonas_sp.AAC.1